MGFFIGNTNRCEQCENCQYVIDTAKIIQAGLSQNRLRTPSEQNCDVEMWNKALQENPCTNPKSGYVCFYNGHRDEVYTHGGPLAAREVIAKKYNVKTKQYRINVVLAEKNGETVMHSPCELP